MDGVWAGKGNLYKRTNYLKEQVFDMGIECQRRIKLVRVWSKKTILTFGQKICLWLVVDLQEV